MSTKVPFTEPPIPVPTNEPQSLVQSLLAIKQKLEADNPRTTPFGAPSVRNTSLNAALRGVTKTLPF